MEEKKRAINWYPGHMTKARRMMEEDIKLVDLVIEIVDARIPLSSRNPDIDKLAKNKARIVLLNKSDLADDTVTDEWITYFKDKGFYCLKLNSRLNVSNRAVNNLITAACSAKIERDRARGIKNRSIKAMIVGIPNVGKSTFINSFTGRKSAKTGNKPGVTKGKQWIRINGSVELLDTPGILWPKIEDRNVGEILKDVMPEDFIKFGLIPEFIGRVPVVVTLDALDENALISILKEPKNSLTKQYHRLFELDGVELDFEDDALELVAKKSLERKTGARGLRAIMEGSLMDLMYKIPSDDTIRKCTITKDVVDGTGEPEIVRGETPAQAKTAGSRRTSRTHKKDKPETA